MKILVTFFPIDDMGGIINHHEQLCAGFRELGHEVTTKLLMFRDHAPRSVAGGQGPRGHAGLKFDQRKGFSWETKDIIPYKGAENLKRWKEYANGFDLVIWQVAVPTKRAENRGNTDWIGLYNVSVPQVAVIHDGNFLDSYPWLHLVRERFAGVACVHTCAFNSAEHIDIPSALVLNPQDVSKGPDLSREAFMRRKKGFLSVQTFKAWKRVPELVAAISHMGNITKQLAGKGIDYYYLTSKDKCKYPKIWEEALGHDMVYLDVITNEQRDHILRNVTLLIDPSWSKKYAAIGGHFNRVMVDAILQGALPVARDLGIGRGPNELFVDGDNCLVIPWDYTPKEFGHLVTEYAHIPYEQYLRIMERGEFLLPKFDRKSIAQQFIDLGAGKSARTGTLSPAVELKSYQTLQEFFNDKS